MSSTSASSANAPARGDRVVQCVIPIHAPPSAVWQALTDPTELMRWFPLEASATLGPGGSLRLCWPGEHDATAAIEIWHPERHLRLVGFPGDGPRPLVTDYLLEGEGGRTVLRVVSSGFGQGDAWDEMFDGVRCGWAFELRSLRHYLERHRGADRHAVWVRKDFTGSHAAVWERLTGPGGWFGAAGLPALVPGEQYTVRTAAGDLLEGRAELWEPPRLVAGTVAGWNDALFRMELWGLGAQARVALWLSTYGVPRDEVAAIRRRWDAALDRVLGDRA